MKEELDKKLVEAYPILYKDRHSDMTMTAMCWGFECGAGWFDIINKLSEKIEAVNNLKLGFIIVADQVKEKYGTLRFYYHSEITGEEDDLTKEQLHRNGLLASLIDDAIDMAEIQTGHTCEVCGKQGKLRDDGWIKCLCDEHAKKDNM